MIQSRQIALLAGAGTAVGFGAGYLIARSQLKAKYAAIADAEIQSVKETYKIVRPQPYSSPEEAVEAIGGQVTKAQLLEELLKRQGYSPETDEKEEPEDSEPENVFETAAQKAAERSPDHPYIITTDEFMTENDDWPKITLTYYEGDDTLCDEREQLVPESDIVVGDLNLTRFKDQPDPNCLYVRNEKTQTDFEVVREEGSYSVMVMGLDEDTLEHMEQRRPHKARWDG